MSIQLGKYSFEGPYPKTDLLQDKSGVYAILSWENNAYTVIDIGESATVKTRLDSHERFNCWERHCNGTIYYAVYYTPNMQQAGRMEIEQELRDKYNPICGER
ncbi:MAG TPA: hypothetical protein PKJ14_01835 [Candidatus Cloacimonadota bacterium]|nr:hypothetical protein [Candidatus Cloacimonadota bacterium]HQL14400.1 hypothetical protein [Candidatus Cloacimonadota bacterium]